MRLNLAIVERGHDFSLALHLAKNRIGEFESCSARRIFFQPMVDFVDGNVVLRKSVDEFRCFCNGVE